MQLTARPGVACGLFLLLLGLGGAARADGFVSFRGAYYKEKSTRVRHPMVDAELNVAQGTVLRGHFLVDEITAASPSAGIPQEFTERRYEAGGDYTQALGDWRIGGGLRFSTEDDWVAKFVNAHAESDLAEKNATLRLGLGFGDDDIGNNVAVNAGMIGTPRISEDLNSYLVSLSLSQILTPTLIASITYDLNINDGYQANVYRRVCGAMICVGERLPDVRWRHALFGSLRGFVPATNTTVFAGYRFYIDDWGLLAHTPELRIVQEIVPGFEARARFRTYTQSAADFYKDVYLADEIMDPNRYVTDDEKLSDMDVTIIGGQLNAALSLFGIGGSWADTRLDFEVERVYQSTSFGDSWTAQLGLHVPMSY